MHRHRLAASVVALAAAACVAVLAGIGVAAGASTAGTVVSVNIASSTNIDATGCAAGASNVTDFGTVLPGSSTVTGADCTVVFGSTNNNSMLRAYQTDTSGTAMFGMSNGSLDATFDTDGKTTTAVLAASDQAYGMAVQADGKIVAVGYANNGANNDFAVVRYNTNGSLDNTFDTDGKTTTDIATGNDAAYAVTIQPDGKIVVVGDANNGGNLDFAVARYNTNGSLDNTFDTDGKTTTAVLAASDQADGMAVQADGKIVAVGYANNGANNDFAVVRYNTNGSLDNTFDTDGKTTTGIAAGHDYGEAAAIQADGRIVVVGYANAGANNDFAIVRYDTNGSLDATFDADGKTTTDIAAGHDSAYALVIQTDGKIVADGYAINGGNLDFAIARYNSNGTLDTAFDTDGKATTDIAALSDIAYAMAIQPDGRIVAAGYANNGANNDFAIVRYNTNGSLDNTFDTDGKTTTAVGTGSADIRAAAIQADGKIVAVGAAFAANQDFAVARYAGGGTVADWSGSWGAANLFAACLHTVSNASATWALAGNGNCTTAIDANWNALPIAASKVAWANTAVANGTVNLRYGFKSTTSQQAGTYVAPLTFEVVAPNA